MHVYGFMYKFIDDSDHSDAPRWRVAPPYGHLVLSPPFPLPMAERAVSAAKGEESDTAGA